MCGIAGYISQERQPTEKATRAMVHALRRRGPDSEGITNWPGATLGHRRLAILDLSPAGNQPMLTDDKQIGIVFNGCIYNFLEIREELEQRGHRFRSRCDTEVLVRGYQEWGIDELVKRLRGMFAFGIWDHPRRTLTLVRDRLGVKPVAYYLGNGEIAFASTIAALRSAGFGGDTSPAAVLEFLEYGFITDENAIYEGMFKLPPATILEWRDGAVTQREYWTLPAPDESSSIRFEDAVEQTESMIIEAVRLRLISDVPIGVLLSGGIDSGLVCWAMSTLNADARAFTVRAPNDPSDESMGAAHTARVLGISHEIVDMPEIHVSLDALVEAYSEPFASPSAQAMLWVSEAVSRRAKVLLTGDGGDDVFFGYPFFRHARMAQRVARGLPAATPAVWRSFAGAIPAMGPLRRAKNFINYATGGIGAHARAHDGYPYYQKRSILGGKLNGMEVKQRLIPNSFDSAHHLLHEVFLFHRRTNFTSEFMPKVDGGTMHFAIEARAPFLDQKIWEFAAALPEDLRLRKGMLKAVLREIVRRRIGPETAFRKKQGFTVPVERWLAERWSSLLDRLRGDSFLEREGWVRRGALAKPIADAVAGRWVPEQLWRLLVLECWLAKNAQRGATVPEGVPAGQLSH